MNQLSAARVLALLQVRLEALGRWSRRGPVRATVTKVVLTLAGLGLLLVGLAMLVLPGPGLVVMAGGLGLLAAEWEWARTLVRTGGRLALADRRALLPGGSSPRRRAAAGVLVAAFLVVGFLATAAATALLGAYTLA